ncbi:hypothetical protein CW751_15130 [Brumimicrobium salinarum]|uniref:Gliding motility-associated C-terminal domain-containing protein n=1 Tax=Brumimicrobium salinarum TaxID=2058658 RepID=A0A2I0QYN5_9FLAO|nr:gliding motility-associated C-terminal domain-containing protein [Brumimicrobium salinarum]PKR79437.1 hypothetical protein CW751_15130 [Brumimicrobium salinarum]
MVTTSEGCQASISKSDFVEVYHNPIADFYFMPDTPNVHNPIVDFNNTSLYADEFTWYVLNDTLTEVNPRYEFPAEADHHKVMLAVATEEGCVDTTFRKIEVLDKIVFYVPNTFTPDQRGPNETFMPVFTSGYDPNDYHFSIYNRWGERIFETSVPNSSWDGVDQRNGKNVPEGTYVWKIEFKETMSTTRHVEYGHVNVLR